MLSSNYIQALPERLQRKIAAKQSSVKVENSQGQDSGESKDLEAQNQKRTTNNIPGKFSPFVITMIRLLESVCKDFASLR